MDFGFLLVDSGFLLVDFGFLLVDSGFLLVDIEFLLVDFGFLLVDFGFLLVDFGFLLVDFGFLLVDSGFLLVDYFWTPDCFMSYCRMIFFCTKCNCTSCNFWCNFLVINLNECMISDFNIPNWSQSLTLTQLRRKS